MTITLRTQTETGTSTKGSTLTHAELDNNFIDLLQNKIKPIDLRGDTGSQIVGQSLSNEILQVVGASGITTAVTSDSAGQARITITGSGTFAAASPGEIGASTPGVGNFLDIKIKSTNSSAGGTVKELQLYDADNTNYVGFKAPSSVSTNKVYVMPSTDGTNGQFLTTNGTGGLSWTSAGGGGSYISWQSSVKTSNFNAVANEGYFCNTQSSSFTATLPSSPTSGDKIAFIDYKNTWNTNSLTVARNGNKIQDDFNDLTANQQRGSVTLIYADATVGWLVQKTTN
jgi:hypothetical protein